jgi:hypothetical protein
MKCMYIIDTVHLGGTKKVIKNAQNSKFKRPDSVQLHLLKSIKIQ